VAVEGRVGVDGGVKVFDGEGKGVLKSVAVGITEGEPVQLTTNEMKTAAKSV
jgi:hypothetical protein